MITPSTPYDVLTLIGDGEANRGVTEGGYPLYAAAAIMDIVRDYYADSPAAGEELTVSDIMAATGLPDNVVIGAISALTLLGELRTERNTWFDFVYLAKEGQA